MSADLSAQFEALRALATKLTKKEEVTDAEFAAAGLAAGTPLKKVNQQITLLKKKVSTASKATNDDDEEDDAGAGAARGGHRQDTRAKKDVRRLGADHKSAVAAMARGEGLLSTNRVGTDGGVFGDDE